LLVLRGSAAARLLVLRGSAAARCWYCVGLQLLAVGTAW